MVSQFSAKSSGIFLSRTSSICFSSFYLAYCETLSTGYLKKAYIVFIAIITALINIIRLAISFKFHICGVPPINTNDKSNHYAIYL